MLRIKIKDKNNIKILLLIVTYNSRRFVKRLCDSILSQKYDLSKIMLIIIDNNSSDNTYDEFLHCIEDNIYTKNNLNYIIIKLDRNVGFAPANNIGLIVARKILYNISDKIIIFLNPDTYILKSNFFNIIEKILEILPFVGLSTLSGSNNIIDSIGAFVDFLGNPQDILCGVKLTNIIERNLLSKMPRLYMVPAVCFAAVAVRGNIIEHIGPLRNDYVIYFEDTEFSLRAWSSSIPVFVYRDFMVWHARGGTQSPTDSPSSYAGVQTERSIMVPYHFAKNQLLLIYEYLGFFRYFARLLLYGAISLFARRKHLALAVASSMYLIVKNRFKRRRLPRGLIMRSPRTWVAIWALKYIIRYPHRGVNEAISYGVRRASFEYIRKKLLKYSL